VAGRPVTSAAPPLGGDGALAGRSAVVTGASRGIGAATVRALALAGARVIGLSRRPGPEVPNAISIQCDLLDSGQTARAVEAVERELGGAPDILVNNAGIFSVRPVEETETSTFGAMLAFNLSVPFVLIQAFLPAMRARKRGDIVTVGSIADHEALPGNAAYAAAKFGARGLHEVLRSEVTGTGVRATLVSPGAVDTSLWDAIEPHQRHRFPSSDAMLRAEDVADAILYAVTRPARVAIGEIRLAKS
jgi:NADP-dependent 3-hydroxy acid dehydrogenase YdfG